MLAAGRDAYQRTMASFDDPPSPLDDAGHSLWVLLVVALMLVAPGLDDWPSRSLLVPAISMTLVTASAIVIGAFTRSQPFGPRTAWLAVTVATALGATAWFVSRRRARTPVPAG